VVAGILRSDPGATLRAVGARLEAIREPAPRGGALWAPGSVAHVLARARRAGLLPEAVGPRPRRAGRAAAPGRSVLDPPAAQGLIPARRRATGPARAAGPRASGAAPCEQRAARPELDEEALAAFGRNMWDHDFVFSVDRAFARACPVPTFLLPGSDVPHPAATSAELAALLPGVEVLADWRGPEHLEAQRSRVLAFLRRHTPAA
jgi:hypothetical protein